MQLGRADFEDVARDLHALKLRLAAMEASDLSEREAQAMAQEISAIRLHLKRLAADREAIEREIARSLGLRP